MKIKVGNITKIKTGKLDANASSPDGKYPFFTCSKDPLKINTYSYDCECVLVAGNGDLNVKYYNGKFDAYQRTYIIEDNSNGLLYMPYLYYFLEGYIEELRKQSIGGVIKYIKLGNLTDALIELPSIEEQKYIVNLMNTSSELIDLRRETINKLDSLVKARFIEMFGDPVLNERKFPTLSGADFFKLSNGRAVPDEKRIEAGIPAYGGNGISWYTDEFLMAEDTIVVGRVGFQSGNVHYVIGPLWITDNAMYISQYDKDKFNLRFLYELMLHVNFSRFQDAGDLKKITQKPFMTFKYILPSMDLQQKFVNFKIEVDKSKLAVQKSLEKTQQLFDSLMQEYFG
ncbi:restriction endonuclease subunit S [Holdemanella biformis]|uniref:restriction endonuclease subunit S n=1 Tax=Holdemanella biformis TaxID=1735 RepID=UPI002943D160|nr:restriction endonuclease subunit S [Holdemanella biformis]